MKGYESVLETAGSLFSNGSYDTYMQITPLTDTREK